MARRPSRSLAAVAALAMAALACQTVVPLDPPTPGAPTPGAATEAAATPSADPTEPAPTPTGSRPDITGRDHGVVQPAAGAGQYLDLSGQDRVYDTVHFRIHYTLTGEDAIPDTGAGPSGAPEFVLELGQQLEQAWAIVIDEWAWVAPPPDYGWGGNDLYDVYIGRDEDDELGYVWTVEEMPEGDNPNSPDVVERHAQGSYMHLRQGFATGAGFGSRRERDDYLHTTVVHEFIHSVQYGYDGGERPEWMWEAVAMWSESLAYPGESDDVSYVIDYVTGAGDCLSQADPYSVWPFFRYLTDRHDRDLVREIWEQARDFEGVNAVRAALRARGLILAEEWLGFAQAMLLRDFSAGDDFHPLIPADRIDAPGSVQRDIGQLGLEVIAVEADGPITIALSGDELAARVIGIRDGQAGAFDPVDGVVVVDTAAFDELIVLVTHASDGSSSNACQHVDYRVRITPGGTPAQPADIIDAPKFTTLR